MRFDAHRSKSDEDGEQQRGVDRAGLEMTDVYHAVPPMNIVAVTRR
jgi:hypothetical protein